MVGRRRGTIAVHFQTDIFASLAHFFSDTSVHFDKSFEKVGTAAESAINFFLWFILKENGELNPYYVGNISKVYDK